MSELADSEFIIIGGGAIGCGIAYALAASALFGASTPLARALIGAMDPLWLAGLLYAGSGIGLSIALAVRHAGAGGAHRRVAAIASGDPSAP